MKKRVGLAVNWFNYPICLSQAWFQQSCSNCGRRWQTLKWRRSTTTAATTATGALTFHPRHRQRTQSSTSMPPPTGSTWVTREKGEPCNIFYIFLLLHFFNLHVSHYENMGQWSLSKHLSLCYVELRAGNQIAPNCHLCVKQTQGPCAIYSYLK